jgi:hypothetical protein
MTSKPDFEVSDDMLMALADGELTGPDASKLLARIKANPDLAARYAVFTATADALRQAMDPGAVPDHLISTVLTAPTGADTATASASGGATVIPLRRKGPVARAMGWPMALAASVALAAGIGGFLAGQSTAPGATGSIDMAAAALSSAATGDVVTLADGSTARALGSFTTDLGLCRMIAVDGSDMHRDRAIVCRDETGQGAGAGWRTALSVSEGGTSQFLPASDVAVEMIDTFLDVIGAGPALTASEEAQALGR